MVALVLVTAGCDWTMFGDGPQHTHYDPTERTIGVGNVGTLTRAWTASIGGSTGGSVGSAAVVNGVAYTGSSANGLSAVSASTGAVLWNGPTGGTDASDPAVVNGVVYTGSADDKLYAFDAAGSTGCTGTPKTCAPLWSAYVGGVSSSPAIANGVLYIGSFVTDRLYAFDATGATHCSAPPKRCTPALFCADR